MAVVLRSSSFDAYALGHPLLMPVLSGLQGVLQEAGLSPILLATDSTEPADRRVAELIRVGGCRGVLTINDIAPDTVDMLKGLNLPTVWHDSPVWEPSGCVRRNERAAGMVAASAAVHAGYRRLTLVAVDSKVSRYFGHRERELGVHEVADRHRVPVDLYAMDRHAMPDVVETVMSTMDPLTAIVCGDYYRLEWVLRALLECGVRPGLDVGVVCCDDGTPFQHMLQPVTRASYDRFASGQMAARMLVRMLAGQTVESVLIEPVLIPGNTATGPRRYLAA